MITCVFTFARENIFALFLFIKNGNLKCNFSSVFLFNKYYNIKERKLDIFISLFIGRRKNEFGSLDKESFVLLFSQICYDFIKKKCFAAIDAINVCNYLPLGLHRSGSLIHTTMWMATYIRNTYTMVLLFGHLSTMFVYYTYYR